MKKSFLSSALAYAGVTRVRLTGLAGAMLLAAGAVTAAPGIGQVGSMAYQWTNLKDLDGNIRNLKDYYGKVVLQFVLENQCGGCKADAGRIGQIAMKYQGKAFQAVATELNRGAYSSLLPLDKMFSDSLKNRAKDVDFPIGIGIPDSQIIPKNSQTAPDGQKWANYDSYRDVFFVIDHTGKIVARIDGNRINTMGESNYLAVDSAISKALNAIPTTLLAMRSASQGLHLQAFKRQGAYQIQFDSQERSLAEDISLRILDSQGRAVRDLDPKHDNSNGEFGSTVWDGKDSRGIFVAWGNYFLNVTEKNGSATLLLPWLP